MYKMKSYRSGSKKLDNIVKNSSNDAMSDRWLSNDSYFSPKKKPVSKLRNDTSIKKLKVAPEFEHYVKPWSIVSEQAYQGSVNLS